MTINIFTFDQYDLMIGSHYQMEHNYHRISLATCLKNDRTMKSCLLNKVGSGYEGLLGKMRFQN